MTPDPTAVIEAPEADDTLAPHPPAPPVDEGSFGVPIAFLGVLLLAGFFLSWWIPGLILGLLGVLFLHELGHYLGARMSGMKVTEFFLGFGPKLWSVQRGETEYGLKAIPAGAYVRIIGMTNLEEVDPAEEHRTYRAQPYWQRMITICAGSAMHFLMAIVALAVLFASYNYPGVHGSEWVVGQVVDGSSAEDLGVEVGDRITSFNGETFDNWPGFGEIVSGTPAGPIEVELERGDETLVLTGDLGARSGDVLQLGFGMTVNEDRLSQGWQVSGLANGAGADTFGLEVGDVLLTVGDAPRPNQLDVAAELEAADGGVLDVEVLRNDETISLSGPIELDRSEPFSGFLGVATEFVESEATWAESVPLAFDDFGTILGQNIGALGSLVNPATYIGGGNDPAPAASAPPVAAPPSASTPDDEGENRPISIVGIFRLMIESESADQVLYIFAIVNIFIGMFNLVPLMPFDGGHAAFATYERGRQLLTRNPDYRADAASLMPVAWVVVGLLVFIGLYAVILDIFAWNV